MTKPTRLDYCQYLLTTPVNYTLTHFADHCERFSHDQINVILLVIVCPLVLYGKVYNHT